MTVEEQESLLRRAVRTWHPAGAARAAGYEAAPELAVEDARAARIYTALSEMADAVSAGEWPQFRSDDQAAAFRRDIEPHYGAGAMERLRAGDTQDLTRDMPDRDQRAILATALKLVAARHLVLRTREPEQVKMLAAPLDRDSGPDLDLDL